MMQTCGSAHSPVTKISILVPQDLEKCDLYNDHFQQYHHVEYSAI